MAEKQAPKTKGKPMTKAAVYQEIATQTKLTRKQVGDVFDALTGVIKQQLAKKGPGVFTLPGLLKLIPFFPDIHAHARAELRQIKSLTGLMPWGVPETTSSCCTWRSKSPLLVMWMVLELDEEPTFTAP